MVHKFSLVIDIFHLFSPMANPKDMFEGIDNLPFNLCETDDFLEDSIDPDNNMSNDSKFSKLDTPYYTPDDLITSSKEWARNMFSIFHLNIRSVNENFRNLTKLRCELKQDFNVIILTESRLKDENANENINQVRVPKKVSRSPFSIFIHNH